MKCLCTNPLSVKKKKKFNLPYKLTVNQTPSHFNLYLSSSKHSKHKKHATRQPLSNNNDNDQLRDMYNVDDSSNMQPKYDV